MEELQIAKVHVSVPHTLAFSQIHRSSANKNEANTIQETRELTEQEKDIAKVGLITIGIVFIICIIVIGIWLYKIWKE